MPRRVSYLTSMREQRAGRVGIRLGGSSHSVLRSAHGCRKPVVRSQRYTRLVSWREPVRAGAHPRTKGTRCFAGGRRRRSDATATGRLTARAACGQGTRRRASRKQDQRIPEDWRHEYLPTRTACAHLAEGRWLGGMRVSRRDRRSGHGGMCLRHDVWSGTFQWAGCPCNRDNACRTRTRRADWCADASPRRTAGRAVTAAA